MNPLWFRNHYNNFDFRDYRKDSVEPGPTPSPRRHPHLFTKNHSQGETKKRRKLAAQSRKQNRR